MGKPNKGGRPTKVVVEKIGKTWNIRYNHNGKRKRYSLKTKCEIEAQSLALHIENLLIDPKAEVSNKAFSLFFGNLPKQKSTKADLGEIEDFDPKQKTPKAIQILMREMSSLRAQLAEALPYQKMYKALQSTREGKLLLQAETLPTVKVALEEYSTLIQHLKRPNASLNYIVKFFEINGMGKKLDETKSVDIQKYLADDCKDKSARWHRQRQIFTQFYNRMETIYAFENPMINVMDKKPEHKADIHWHKLTEVNKFLKGLKTDYSKALFSTLFFSGVTASEFRGLRVCDYFEINGQWVLRVTPNECRSIKRAKRRRNINVGTRLKKALDKHLKSHKGGPALFPPVTGFGEYWTSSTFTSWTRKYFPADMNCLSTRRTFGSLLIRQGVSGTEVAATMGNSLLMVDLHYGRIKSQEVKALDI